MPWLGIIGLIAPGSGLIGGAGPNVNIAARAAAANPRRPTPAMPASPPLVVSGSRAGGDFSGGVAAGGGGPPMKGRWLSADGRRIWSMEGRAWSMEGRIWSTEGRMLAADGARIRTGSFAGVLERMSVE